MEYYWGTFRRTEPQPSVVGDAVQSSSKCKGEDVSVVCHVCYILNNINGRRIKLFILKLDLCCDVLILISLKVRVCIQTVQPLA